MPPVNVLIKPASGSCNLRCRYCFYHDETEKRSVPLYGFMSRQTAQALVQKALAHGGGKCTFGFQGGEPTLAGLDFFRDFVALEQQYLPQGGQIHNAIQTNGTLLNSQWAQFLKENHFLVGLSLDGDELLHDLYRRDGEDKGTFRRVMDAARLLTEYGVDFNILTVVTAQTAKRIGEIYPFFMKQGLTYQQYIPVLDPIGEARGGAKWSLTPELYARFLKKLFDLWYADRAAGKFVYIRYFENLAGMLKGVRPESCGMGGVCGIQYALEADGSVYPCDFYMLDDHRLGNVNTEDFAQLDKAREELGFLSRSMALAPECLRCRYGTLCRGGCYRDRNDHGLNYYCQAFSTFFPYALPRLMTLIQGEGGQRR